MSDIAVSRALLSVFDKTGIAELAAALHGRGVELVSTGGTAAALAGAGLPVRDAADLTGFPETMDGRVKTLHPAIHGGLLARRDDAGHVRAMTERGFVPIDLLVSNLYPFEETDAAGAPWDEAIETIDIGGPAMIRSAAKNHAFVAVLVDPADYGLLLREMDRKGGATSLELRRRLAAVAFGRTAAYDAAIARRFDREAGGATFPRRTTVAGERALLLRYGENPHQEAALYRDGTRRGGAATARRTGGKELSFNNFADADAAFELVAEFDEPAVAIVKHANPCGAAAGASLAEAHGRALACDPASAYGGVVAANRPLDADAARAIAAVFTEVVIAPGADEDALAVLGERKALRLLLADGLPDPARPGIEARTLPGGFLVQTRDGARADADDLRIVTRRRPTSAETADMLFAFRVAKHARSNAVVYARDRAAVGIGAGQTSRLDAAASARAKAARAGLSLEGSAAASDAFFPFADGLLEMADAGATAVVQPGGSIRDDEVVAAADDRGMAMALTGMRCFRH